MESCDVLIVGGGPAGSSCAWRLREAGLDVLVLDKATFPRHKVCAGWITPAVFDALEIDPAEYGQGRVLQPLRAFRVGLLGRRLLRVEYDRPVSFGIRRSEFDHYLLQRSAARTKLGEPVRTIARAGSGWIVNERLRAPLVVAAGGHFCPVARLLGTGGDAGRRRVAAQEIEFLVDGAAPIECPVEAGVPEIYFCRDLKGYGWCIRKGNYLNVGLGREGCRQVARHAAEFCDYLRRQGKVPRELPGRLRGHAYLLYGQRPRAWLDDGVLAVGDAAALAYPQSGEGIRPAVESGLIAADVILAAEGDYRRDRLEAYRRQLRARFGRPDRRTSSRRPPLSSLRSFIGRRLLASRWFLRRVVLERWFLRAGQDTRFGSDMLL